jgi:DNA-binding phage protein
MKKPQIIIKGKKSNWAIDADFRIKNRKWLRYSSYIARRVLAAIEDTENMNQKVLASKVGVSTQYINKVLKGQENLTLKTIATLSDAIGFELLAFPPYKYSSPTNFDFSGHNSVIVKTSNIVSITILYNTFVFDPKTIYSMSKVIDQGGQHLIAYNSPHSGQLIRF